MAFKLSSALREQMMVVDSFKALMDNTTLKIYGGAVPLTADDEIGVGATLLCEVKNVASNITFEATAVGGLLQKTSAESWSGLNLVTGTATFYRLEHNTDNQLVSSVFKRVQGQVGIAGMDMNLTSVSLILGATTNIDYFSILLPTY